ncbi:MAG: hypothetical protein OEW23_19790 [Candidatus Aminicenantes bacterium]|nr:hypothetical protein [Candidatus Aminicenantes bacterium]
MRIFFLGFNDVWFELNLNPPSHFFTVWYGIRPPPYYRTFRITVCGEPFSKGTKIFFMGRFQLLVFATHKR